MFPGADYPEDLTPYDLIIQCGACMFNLGTGIGSSLHNGEFKVDPDALK